MRELGRLLRSARSARRWPRTELAQRLLVSPATVQRMENGLPTVQIGIYVAAMDLLGLGDAWLQVVQAGRTQLPLSSAKRARRSRDEVF